MTGKSVEGGRKGVNVCGQMKKKGLVDRRRGWGEEEDRGGKRKELEDVRMVIGDQEPLM
jgi:hypothetical protein